MQFKIYFILVLLATLWNVCLTATKFPILIVISFDGFRFDYINKSITPNLYSLASDGVRAKWMNNVFVTKTFPNHFSIATGLYEDIHGIVSNYMFDPETEEVFDVKTMNQEHWWNNNFSTPIWIANQMSNHDRHSGCVFWSGMDVPYLNGQLPCHSLPYNLDISWTDRVDNATSWLTLETDPANLILFYFEEPDATAHKYGPDSEEVKLQIQRADNITGYLIKKLKSIDLFTKANIIVLSDHGMATVTNVIDLDEFVDPKIYKTYGASPVFNLWPNKGKEEVLYQQLKDASSMHNFAVYKREDIPNEYQYKRHRRILPIIVEANEGYQLVNAHQKKEHNQSVWGDHGYNNSLSSMHPIFIAHGPAFKSSYVSDPFMNIDVYPLMCNILGIQAPENNGSISNIAHILQDAITHPSIHYPAYIAIIVSIFLAILLVGAAFNTAIHYKPLNNKYRYSHEPFLLEEKESLLFSEE